MSDASLSSPADQLAPMPFQHCTCHINPNVDERRRCGLNSRRCLRGGSALLDGIGVVAFATPAAAAATAASRVSLRVGGRGRHGHDVPYGPDPVVFSLAC